MALTDIPPENTIARRAARIIQEGEFPDRVQHGYWRAECMIDWLNDQGIYLSDQDPSQQPHPRPRVRVRLVEDQIRPQAAYVVVEHRVREGKETHILQERARIREHISVAAMQEINAMIDRVLRRTYATMEYWEKNHA